MMVIISVFRKVDISAVSESHVFFPIPGPFTDEDHEVCLKALEMPVGRLLLFVSNAENSIV